MQTEDSFMMMEQQEPSLGDHQMLNPNPPTYGQTSMKSTDCEATVPTMTSSERSTSTRTISCNWSQIRNWLQCLFLLGALTILAYQQVLLLEMNTNSQKIVKEM